MYFWERLKPGVFIFFLSSSLADFSSFIAVHFFLLASATWQISVCWLFHLLFCCWFQLDNLEFFMKSCILYLPIGLVDIIFDIYDSYCTTFVCFSNNNIVSYAKFFQSFYFVFCQITCGKFTFYLLLVVPF